MYPRDTKDASKPGRLRLLYEANPVGMIMEQAGGRASTGEVPMMGVQPTSLHQRIGFVFGSKNEVERIERYHAEPTTYADLDEGVRIANDTEYGLSATISGDPAEAVKVAGKLRAGIVTINSWGPDGHAPFGGYKQSGNGREGGVFGLRDFMEVKSVIGG
jgi:hypothetical protein